MTEWQEVTVSVEVQKCFQICRDPKDDFLLNLSLQIGADYLLTGDRDLLDLNPSDLSEVNNRWKTQIISVADFLKRSFE